MLQSFSTVSQLFFIQISDYNICTKAKLKRRDCDLNLHLVSWIVANKQQALKVCSYFQFRGCLSSTHCECNAFDLLGKNRDYVKC